jgi:hypothetical protein
MYHVTRLICVEISLTKSDVFALKVALLCDELSQWMDPA